MFLHLQYIHTLGVFFFLITNASNVTELQKHIIASKFKDQRQKWVSF